MRNKFKLQIYKYNWILVNLNFKLVNFSLVAITQTTETRSIENCVVASWHSYCTSTVNKLSSVRIY